MKETLCVILGGGAGHRLFPLTRHRSKPAVPLGGKYRLIDIPVSNCLHSGLGKIYVLTQFNSVSLHRHISSTYQFDRFSRNFVEILAAMQTPERKDWYQGTADAVRKNLRHLNVPEWDTLLILSGDQLYRMNFRNMIAWHQKNGAEVTLAVIPVERSKAGELGILQVNEQCFIRRFVEKPQEEKLLDELQVEDGTLSKFGIESKGRTHLASMGIYLFQREILVELLDNEATDFGKEIIPSAIGKRKALAFLYDGYWEDIGTIQAFYEANLALTERNPQFDFWGDPNPIYTRPRQLPASKVYRCEVESSILAEGCIVEESTIRHSIVGIRSMISRNAVLQDTVMMGADFYESVEDLRENQRMGRPGIGIGPGSEVRRAIIDKNVRIGAGARIFNSGGEREFDGEFYFIREGIIVIPKNAVVPPATRIGS